MWRASCCCKLADQDCLQRKSFAFWQANTLISRGFSELHLRNIRSLHSLALDDSYLVPQFSTVGFLVLHCSEPG